MTLLYNLLLKWVLFKIKKSQQLYHNTVSEIECDI